MSRASLRGVTRFELILGTSTVLLIVSLLVGLTRGQDASKADSAEVTARQLLNAVTDWRREHADLGCPTVSQLVIDRAWSRDHQAADPWGGRYRILCSEEQVQVRSAGGDGEFETADDVAIDARWNS